MISIQAEWASELGNEKKATKGAFGSAKTSERQGGERDDIWLRMTADGIYFSSTRILKDTQQSRLRQCCDDMGMTWSMSWRCLWMIAMNAGNNFPGVVHPYFIQGPTAPREL